MSRMAPGNVAKVLLVILFFPFIAFFLLVIGIGAKNKKLALEGAAYAGVFVVALSIPTESALGTLSAFLGLGALIVSAARAYQVRSLWLRGRTSESQPTVSVQEPGRDQLTSRPSQPSPSATQSSAYDLSSALAWVTSHAKRNKHRLPSDAYVLILETCHTLDAVIDAEREQPLADARFEYELEAMVREYLPGVLKGYLAIPPSMVDNRQPNGRSANEEFAEQLQLLSGQAEALHANRHSHTSADLTTTGNFLRERFGHQRKGNFDFGIE